MKMLGRVLILMAPDQQNKKVETQKPVQNKRYKPLKQKLLVIIIFKNNSFKMLDFQIEAF